jgi:hypothetical protein
MAGTVSLRTLPIFISGQNLNKTQTLQEALRSPLAMRILPQQLIRNDSEISACMSLLGKMVKKADHHTTVRYFNIFQSTPGTPTSRV